MLNSVNQTQTVCKKYQINLQKSKTSNTYSLDFNIKNQNIDLTSIINFNFYLFLAKINDECIESVKLIRKLSESSATFLFLFNSISKDFGIPKKYMYIKTDVISNCNTIIYNSESIEIHDDIKSIVKGYELITCNSSSLKINLRNNHEAKINYNFDLNIYEDLPIYLKHLPGLMMKKIFYNLKLFIEKLQ